MLFAAAAVLGCRQNFFPKKYNHHSWFKRSIKRSSYTLGNKQKEHHAVLILDPRKDVLYASAGLKGPLLNPAVREISVIFSFYRK